MAKHQSEYSYLYTFIQIGPANIETGTNVQISFHNCDTRINRKKIEHDKEIFLTPNPATIFSIDTISIGYGGNG